MVKTFDPSRKRRRSETIAGEVELILTLLENGSWKQVFTVLKPLYSPHDIETEKTAVAFIKENFRGFGPKQSRNLLQSLGLTLYEIPKQ